MKQSLYEEVFNVDFSAYTNSYIFFLTDETIEVLLDNLKIDLDTLKLWNEKAGLSGNLVASKNAVRNRMIRTINGDSFPFDVRKNSIDPNEIDTVSVAERGSNTIITIVGFPLSEKQYDILEDIKAVGKMGPLRSVIYVEGPYGLDEVTVEVKSSSGKMLIKQFYLFSDVHVHMRQCPAVSTPYPKMEITKFLEHIMEKDPTFVDKRIKYEPIDFFLEVSHSDDINRDFSQFGLLEGTPRGESNSYLMDIRRALYNCFQRSKTKCKDQQNRYHWSDSRFRGIFKEWLDFFYNYKDILRFGEMVKIMLGKEAERIVPIMMAEANALMNRTPDNVDELFKIAKIHKQLENIYDKELATRIKIYYTALFLKKWVGVKKQFKIIYDKFQRGEDALEDALRVNAEILFSLSLIMDAYVMARSFREFKTPGKEGLPLNNIIIYAGGKHIESMFMLLSGIGKVGQRSMSFNPQAGDYQCLRIDLPLFLL
jgi:hypothetical protein